MFSSTLKKGFLSTQAPVVLDGGLATTLMQHGFIFPFEEVARQNPQALRALHAEFLCAGANWILTNTFSLSPLTVAPDDEAAWQKKLALLSLNLEQAVLSFGTQTPHFAVTLGDAGERKFSADSKKNIFKKRFYDFFSVVALFPGIEAFVLETITDLKRAGFVLETFMEWRCQEKKELPCVASVTTNMQGHLLADASPLKKWLPIFLQQADGVGFNCMLPTPENRALWQQVRAQSDKVVWLKPSCNNDLTAVWRDAVLQAQSEGYTFVGGCCGVAPNVLKLFTASL